MFNKYVMMFDDCGWFWRMFDDLWMGFGWVDGCWMDVWAAELRWVMAIRTWDLLGLLREVDWLAVQIRLGNGGFHSHGGTPIAGWFIWWKLPQNKNGCLGVPPWLSKPLNVPCSCGRLNWHPWEPSKLSQVPMDSVIDISKMPGMVGKKLLGRMLWMAAVWWDRKLIWRWDINFFCEVAIPHPTYPLKIYTKPWEVENFQETSTFATLDSDSFSFHRFGCLRNGDVKMFNDNGTVACSGFRSWSEAVSFEFLPGTHWTFWQLRINVAYPLVN